MAQFLTPSLLQVLNSSGQPYSGAKLYIYQTGTTTALSLYSDEALATPAANPVVADSAGYFANVFIAETKFKAVIKDSSDVTLKTLDPVYSIGASDAVSAANVSFDGTAIGYAATNVQDAIEEVDTVYAALTGAAFTGAVTITRSVIGAYLSMESTEAGASSGPNIEMYRNSATPAASDALGSIIGYGEDDAGNKQQYTGIKSTISDPTSGSEDGILTVETTVAGTLADRVHVGGGVYTEGVTGGDKGAGTVNATTLYQAGVAVPFSKSYDSGEVTIATSIDKAHSLGAVPTMMTMHIVCKTADLNYSVGDVVDMTGRGDAPGTVVIGMAADATNISFRASSITAIRIPDKTTGAATAITNANWKLIFRAYV